MSTDAIGRKIARIRAGAKPRLLDLFAGCGGVSLGFQAAGYTLQAAIEFDPALQFFHRRMPPFPRDFITLSASVFRKRVGTPTYQLTR